jgi:glutathione S-transferase
MAGKAELSSCAHSNNMRGQPVSIKLYGEIRSAYFARVAIVLAAKGLSYEAVLPPADFGHFAPLRKIPVLQLADGRHLPESAVIMEYLEDAYPEIPVLPANAYDRARARLVGHFCDLYIEPLLLPVCRQYYTDERHPADNVMRAAEVARIFGMIEGLIDGAPYLIGTRLTLADAALAPFIYYAMVVMPVVMSIDPLETMPALRRWWAAMGNDAIVGPILSRLHASFVAVDRLEYGKRFNAAV